MKLLTQAILRQLPPLGSQEEKKLDAVAVVKFFIPDAGWTWWATEFDGKDLFFGLVHGMEEELGYFRLSELKQIRGVGGLPVERDLYFKPRKLRELMRSQTT